MPHSTPFLRAIVVAHNPETLDGLVAYLKQVGVLARGSRWLQPLDLPQDTAALVVFPDDFGVEQACAALAPLRRARPRMLTVLITREPHRFKSLDDGVRPLVLLPKPSFGWSILDAIRSRAEAAS